jgi:hypothetical protein
MWNLIKFESDVVKVSGRYFTSIISVHYNNENNSVRIAYESDRCTDEEFLEHIYQKLPKLKDCKLINIHDDNLEWLCDWNKDNKVKKPYMITVLFFK